MGKLGGSVLTHVFYYIIFSTLFHHAFNVRGNSTISSRYRVHQDLIHPLIRTSDGPFEPMRSRKQNQHTHWNSNMWSFAKSVNVAIKTWYECIENVCRRMFVFASYWSRTRFCSQDIHFTNKVECCALDSLEMSNIHDILIGAGGCLAASRSHHELMKWLNRSALTYLCS